MVLCYFMLFHVISCYFTFRNLPQPQLTQPDLQALRYRCTGARIGTKPLGRCRIGSGDACNEVSAPWIPRIVNNLFSSVKIIWLVSNSYNYNYCSNFYVLNLIVFHNRSSLFLPTWHRDSPLTPLLPIDLDCETLWTLRWSVTLWEPGGNRKSLFSPGHMPPLSWITALQSWMQKTYKDHTKKGTRHTFQPNSSKFST